MAAYIWVGVGGAVGAVARYAVTGALETWTGGAFPWGTLVVNVVGSLALGWLLAASEGWALGAEARLLLGTGLCGALTTFSTFTVEILRLAQRGDWGLVLAYLAGNLALGLLAAALGLRLGRVA